MAKLKRQTVGFLYRHLLKHIFFLFDPELVHRHFINLGRVLGSCGFTRFLTRATLNYQNPKLIQTIAGITFKNPVGLAAGFDKEAYLTGILPEVGFGFEECGSVTALPFAGNERPCMWRLPKERALRVNYGLMNSGAQNIHQRLSGRKLKFPLGVSIAKTNSEKTSHLEAGIADFCESYKIFQDVGDYFTLNISCPNTCETKPLFAEPKNLEALLVKLFSLPKAKPVFIKLSPDLSDEQLEGILNLGNRFPVDGFICTNLIKTNHVNHIGKGGFSGKLVEAAANRTIVRVYKYYGGKKIIIGCGGVFTAADAYKKIKLGASLIQLVTGMIFEGPQAIGEINSGLVDLLTAEGYQNISEAVGKGING